MEVLFFLIFLVFSSGMICPSKMFSNASEKKSFKINLPFWDKKEYYLLHFWMVWQENGKIRSIFLTFTGMSNSKTRGENMNNIFPEAISL